METLIVPAIIAKNQSELDEMIDKVKGKVKRIMLDAMDGEFVSNNSLMFDFKVPDDFEYEAHLMVNKPLDWIDRNADKIDIAIMQVESLDDIEEAIDHVKKKGLKVTLALKPETKLDVILPHIDKVDSILVLTVNLGNHCLESLVEPLEKVKKLREINKTMPLEVDGCMNPQDARLAKEAGADVIASGTYIFKSENVEKAINELKEAAS